MFAAVRRHLTARRKSRARQFYRRRTTARRRLGIERLKVAIEPLEERVMLSLASLDFSTFLGGSADENGISLGAVTVDAAGNSYVVGNTDSADFPATGGSFDSTHNGGSDAFVAKFNPDKTLAWATFLGGSGDDRARDVAVDTAGAVYVTGGTKSTNFPTSTGAAQTSLAGGEDAFVAKLDAAGSTLLYSTYVGGGSPTPNAGADDSGQAITVDASGNAFVTGITATTDFPTTAGAFQTSIANPGGSIEFDAFVSKLNSTGSSLTYSTYLGGSNQDFGGDDIVVDASGNAIVVGGTFSSNFPTTAGVLQPGSAGGADGFITKLNASGSGLVFSTYLGGSSGPGSASGERVSHLTVDGAGDLYVTGRTGSSNFPTTAGAFQTSYGGGASDSYMAKINPTATSLVFSTFLGGSDADDNGLGAAGIALDGAGNIVVAGATRSSNFPTTTGAFRTTLSGPQDGFVSRLDPTGSTLIESTYLGGSGSDRIGQMTVGNDGTVYVSGGTNSADFPTTAGAFDTSHNGNNDAFLTTFGPVPPGPPDILDHEPADIFGREPNGTWWRATNDCQSFTNEAVGFWSATAGWRDVMFEDFDGDGQTDVLGRTAGGDWWIAHNDGTQLSNRPFGRWSGGVGWNDVSLGDFSGDGLPDVIGRTDGGQWWLGRNTPGGLVNEAIGFWAPGAGWTDVLVGNFVGDERADLIGRASSGAWWVAEMTDAGLQNAPFGFWSPGAGWTDVAAVDFNGDGRTDVVGRTGAGSWWLGASTGGGLANVHLGNWSAIPWNDVQIADFSGDGLPDLLGRTDGGDWWLSRNVAGTGLNTVLYGHWAPVEWLDVLTADFTCDGLTDVAGRTAGGDWWVGSNDGGRFVNALFGHWAPIDWRDVAAGPSTPKPNITDSDEPGVTITQSSAIEVTEGLAQDPGPSNSYTVVLDTAPTADVAIAVQPDNQVGVSPSNLTFTPGNWIQPQTVVVSAIDDVIGEGDHTGIITHSASSTDPNYNGITIDSVTANIRDNDPPPNNNPPGVTIVESGGSTDVVEGIGADTYTVVLDTQPVGNVVISVQPDNQVNLAPANLFFSPTNWDQPQTVTVEAVDDPLEEGNHTGTITHTATTPNNPDPNYNGIEIDSVTVNISEPGEVDGVWTGDQQGPQLGPFDLGGPLKFELERIGNVLSMFSTVTLNNKTEQIDSGSVNGNEVDIKLSAGTIDWNWKGTIAGTVMSGAVTAFNNADRAFGEGTFRVTKTAAEVAAENESDTQAELALAAEVAHHSQHDEAANEPGLAQALEEDEWTWWEWEG